MCQFLLMCLAIENFADILTNCEVLRTPRGWIKDWSIIGRLSQCKYCQIYWLALAVTLIPNIPQWIFVFLALHRIAFLFSEFCDRYVNNAPISLFVQKKTL